MARPLPSRMPAGCMPDMRSASRVPSAASTAKARWVASSDENSTASQNRPGRGPVEHAAVGVEGEPEQQQHEQGERRHLVRGDAAAQLDPQVLAGHEAARQRTTVPRPRRDAARRRRRW